MTDAETVMRAKTRDHPREGDRAFDAWIRQELARRYGASLAEPVPQDLLSLLGED